MSVQTYLRVYVALVALAALTIGAAFVDLGPANTAVSLGIATVKSLLILLYFMHVIKGDRVIWLFAGAGLFWAGILLALTMSDVLTRRWPAAPYGG